MSSYLFHYDSREHHQPLNRQKRFAAYTYVLIAISLAMNVAFLYRNEWSSEGDAGRLEYWQILLLVLSVMGAIALLAVIVGKQSKIGYTSYQYLNVTEEGIEWLFNKRKGQQSLAFSEIKYALQDPRHLILKKLDGEEVWLENYLVEDRELEWGKFIDALTAKIDMK